MTTAIDLFGATFQVLYEGRYVFVEENRWHSGGHGLTLAEATDDLRIALLEALASLNGFDDELTQDAKELREWLRGLAL